MNILKNFLLAISFILIGCGDTSHHEETNAGKPMNAEKSTFIKFDESSQEYKKLKKQRDEYVAKHRTLERNEPCSVPASPIEKSANTYFPHCLQHIKKFFTYWNSNDYTRIKYIDYSTGDDLIGISYVVDEDLSEDTDCDPGASGLLKSNSQDITVDYLGQVILYVDFLPDFSWSDTNPDLCVYRTELWTMHRDSDQNPVLDAVSNEYIMDSLVYQQPYSW